MLLDAAGDAGLAAFAVAQLFFFLLWAALMVLSIGSLVLHIVALVDVAKMQWWQFVPPGEPVKSSWLLGLGLGFVIPFGGIVTTVLWWRQVRNPKRAGLLAERPFWMSSSAPPTYPYQVPGGPPGMPPPGPGPWGPPPGPPADGA